MPFISAVSHPTLARWARAIGFAFPYRKTVGGILVLTLLQAGLNSAEPLLLKSIFDSLVATPAAGGLMAGIGGLIVLALGREALSGSATWLTWRTRLGLHYRLLDAAVGRLHGMPLRMQKPRAWARS